MTTPDTGKCEFEAQLQCFRMQLELAAEMNRAVSVHSVRCHGQMLSLLREIADDLPPAVALHSFTGSSQMVDGQRDGVADPSKCEAVPWRI